MNYCNKANQIQTYAPSGAGNFKNVDCVSLESDSITCTTLTIDGDPWDNNEISTLSQKVINQSATSNPATTTFTGSLYADDIDVASGEISSVDVYCDTLRPIGLNTSVNINAPVLVNGSITSTDSLTVLNSNSTGDTAIAGFFQPLLSTNNSMKIQLGKSALTTDQCGEITFTHTSTPSTTNYMSLHLLNRQSTSAVRVYPTYVDVIGELRSGTNYPIIPRTISVVTTLSGAISPFLQSTVSASARRIVINITDVKKTTLGPIAITPLTGGSPNGFTVTGSVWGNNAAAIYGWTGTSMFLWNASTYPADNAGSPRTFSYTIIITSMGSIGGFETYTVDGQGSDSQNQYYISFGGTLKANAAGQKMTQIQLNRNDTGSFTSGYASVLYY